MTSNMKYQILTSTRNAGEYAPGAIFSTLSAAQKAFRATRPGSIHWRTEGKDCSGYASKNDMADDDKAIVRIRKIF
jgi:hypothetical protein